jgi:outer membrane beta-barrel protein
MTISRLLAVLVLCPALLTGQSATAAPTSADQGGDLYSVEQRHTLGTHELTAAVGILPLDAYFKGVTFQGSYTYNFNHLWGWEVIGGMYSFNIDTGLEKDLREQFDVVPELEEKLYGFLYSNAVVRPLYGKLGVINKTTIAAEIFFVAGPTIAFKSASRPWGMDFGGGIRFFVGRYSSIRLDIRDYFLFPGAENNLHISLGLSLTFGFEDERKDEE